MLRVSGVNSQNNHNKNVSFKATMINNPILRIASKNKSFIDAFDIDAKNMIRELKTKKGDELYICCHSQKKDDLIRVSSDIDKATNLDYNDKNANNFKDIVFKWDNTKRGSELLNSLLESIKVAANEII